MKNLYAIKLERSDIIELEAHLVQDLREIISFTSHGLYFPTIENTPKEPQWIAKERTLLLPLQYEGENFGVFMARGAKTKDIRRVLSTLASLTSLCLKHLLCIKQSRIDELTGLMRMSQLFLRMEHDADMARTPLVGNNANDFEAPTHKACMGLLVLRCPNLMEIASDFGYRFAHLCVVMWAKTIRKYIPQEALAARSDEHECTILLPAATRKSCKKFAELILSHINTLTIQHASSKRVVKLQTVAGFALLPHDIEDSLMGLPMTEKAHHLLKKARLAAQIAHDCQPYEQVKQINNKPIAYANILKQSGIIKEILPQGQLLTNLGSYIGASVGLYFSVWGKNGRKGEVQLIEVKEEKSIAKIILHDPTWPLEQGDNLLLANENVLDTPNAEQGHINNSSAHDQDATTHNNISLNIVTHAEFLQRLSIEQDTRAHFSLAQVRLGPENDSLFDRTHDKCLEKTIKIYDSLLTLTNYKDVKPILCGKYGEISLIFLHKTQDYADLNVFYTDLVKKAKAQEIELAVGMAVYPYLQYSKADMVECCRKALDLALLLPAPQIGHMGSLALNISADQHYSRGSIFEAVEEYKLALLADKNNTMAWNSLGVCMAALSRPSDARQYFNEALKLWKKNPPSNENKSEFIATLYNLGTVCQSLNELRSATRYFKQCIEADNEHYFAHIRLGQLAHSQSKLRQARQYFNIAATFEDANKTYGGLARRHLAKIALQENKEAETRELIHETLLRNPQDAIALCMLAKLYLDRGEDPQMSEMLARKSIGLRPEYTKGWQILAKSLRALGRIDEATLIEHKF